MVMSVEAGAIPDEGVAVERLLALDGPAYRLAARVLGSREGAEDIVQQAYVEALKRVRQGPPLTDERAWFLRMVANRAKNHLKAEARRRRREAVVAGPGIVSTTDDREMVRCLRQAMERLEGDYRLPVALCCEEGLSQREAAAVLELPESTLRDRLREGLSRLRELMTKAGYTAAPAAILAGLAHTAPPVPASLASSLTKLAVDSAGVALEAAPTAGTAASAALKGGIIVKIGLGMAALGLAVGATFWAVGGNSGEPGGKAESAKTAPYDPTAQPDFKGPEEVSGPEEPEIPGGFHLEKFAFANSGGLSLDGGRRSCVTHNLTLAKVAGESWYFLDNIECTVNLLKDGRVWRIAGTGRPGDAEGPAEVAEFYFGVYGENMPSMVVDRNGDIYVSDNRNGKVKKIFQKDGRWFVKTVAGGGKAKAPAGAGQTADALQVALDPGDLALKGRDRDHLLITSGRKEWVNRYLLFPDGKLKWVGNAKESLALGIDEGGPKEGFDYLWHGVGQCTAVLYRVSRKDGSRKLVAGIPKAGQRQPVDGPVNDCTFFLTSGPLRYDGRAIYTIGGDEWCIRRIMNGKVMTLDTGTGKWITSRNSRSNLPGGGMKIRHLSRDGFAYMTGGWRRGGGLYCARLFVPPEKAVDAKGGAQ